MGLSLIDRACAEQVSTFLLFGRTSVGSLIERDGLTVIDTGLPIPLFNGVLDTTVTDPNELDAAIADTIAHFSDRELPFLWWTRPTTPPEVAERLLDAGFQSAGSQPVMTHALSDPAKVAPVDGLVIRPVRTADDLASYCNVLVQGFGMPEFVGETFATLLRELGTGPESEAQNFIGALDGEDVATSTTFVHGDTAGVYNIATLEAARRRGVGAAMTVAAEDAARERGFDLATLQSSEAGYRVYESLGYEQICTFDMFTPEPDE